MVEGGIGDLDCISLELKTFRDDNRIEEIPAGDILCQFIFFVYFGCTFTDFEFHSLLCIVQGLNINLHFIQNCYYRFCEVLELFF